METQAEDIASDSPLSAADEARFSELAERWRRAREAALAAPPAEQARRMFENSHFLGQGFARFHRAPVAPEQLPAALALLQAPCLQGRWSDVEGEAALRLERPRCCAAPTAAGCDLWREAIDGLVLGMTGGVRHARHQSAGHGDPSCLDVLYADPQSPLRYGPLSDELQPGLESVRRLVSQFKGAEIEFLGVCEGELLYRLTAPPSDPAVACGASGPNTLQKIVESCLTRNLPTLKPRELSPRSPL